MSKARLNQQSPPPNYSKTGKWKDARQMRDLMEAKEINKVPAESREIHLMLEEIMKRLKVEGYVGNISEVLLDLDEEGKEMALSLHSENWLLPSAGTPIRNVKNLWICGDCHVAIKMISRIFVREIVVRDCNRFHHFSNGICSCKDFR
ncbi:hypothetical protein RHSIM_Rhsim13G0010000 [Rhododendron simsii]|uniref:DYW domain-containing protein n=1 Tax=Rhododendron simsii TaxID=118357 RepID=A0A834FYG1_RHOSS|nr:hypothetical protein RHSIM_Rhsim13G0010000 [Rhododendron simsii]